MWYVVIFVIGILTGAISVVTYALMVANTRHEEAARKVKTNGDMLRACSNEKLAEFIATLLQKHCGFLVCDDKDCNIYRIMGTCKKEGIEMWLKKEADAEWKE